MKIKPQKQRSLVIKGGKSIYEQPFEVAGEIIPSIQTKPLKNLGTACNSSVTDNQTHDDLKKKIKVLVQNNVNSLLTGIMKVWVYQKLSLAMI